MNICMVLADLDFPPDIRVEKEARSLVSEGHRVLILCSHKRNRPVRSVWNGIEIKRIAPLALPGRKINSLIYWLSMRDLHWHNALQKVIEKHAIDALHVHDLPMVGTALSVAKRKCVAVIADLHENYPALARMRFSRRTPRLAQRFIFPGRWDRLETGWASRCHHILVVVDEAKERLVGKGIAREKITVIENTVDVQRFLSMPLDETLMDPFRDDFVICYTGGFSPHRGLDTAVKAMPQILRQIPAARLLLVGDGEMMSDLQFLTKRTGVEERVVFAGWQPFEKLPSYIAASDVCIVPHISTGQTEATAPHKLYHYMLMGKPVVVSSCRPLRRPFALR